MPTLFVSDLHLSPEIPRRIALFCGFLRGAATRARRLYILGDLFEAWLGDDAIPSAFAPVLRELHTLSARGVAIGVMHGNRDFLLGEHFAEQSGCRLLPDPYRIDLHGVPTLLMHGDTLCTDDTPYQELRRQLRDPDWQAAFLAKAPEERIALARELRRVSEQEVRAKECSIMDVNRAAVESAFRDHGVQRIIHGHTHRPAHHRFFLEGAAVERLVLDEWRDTGSVLRCDGTGCRSEAVEETSACEAP